MANRNRTASAGPLTREQIQAVLPKINRRIEELRKFDVNSIAKQFDAAVNGLSTKVNATIAEIYPRGTEEYAQYAVEFTGGAISMGFGSEFTDLRAVRETYAEEFADAITQLNTLSEILHERLGDMLQAAVHEDDERSAVRSLNRRVFIVHGRDEAAKQQVARFLEKLKFDPIILHEQPNLGRTIIEKLESHLDVDYAVVLLTPDDVGALANNAQAIKPRARQNVILELGLFIGHLKRSRVCALHKGNIDLPSDYDGILYVPMDDGGAWKLKLASEMKASGLDIDMNLAV